MKKKNVSKKALERFLQEIIYLTQNHGAIGDYAVVFPNELSKALVKLDPEWFNHPGSKP